MFNFKKIVCLLFLFPCVFSMNVVYASESDYADDMFMRDYNDYKHQDEILQTIIDCYVKIREKCKLDNMCGYTYEDISPYINWKNFMKELEQTQLNGEKMYISNEAMCRLFLSLIYTNDNFKASPQTLVSTIYIESYNVKNSDIDESILYLNRSSLIFKFKDEWVVLDPLMAMQAQTDNDGLRYLTIPLETYKRWIEKYIDGSSIYVVCGDPYGDFGAMAEAISLEQLDGETITNLWYKHRNSMFYEF